LGIADAEFWRITPRQLGLLAKRFEGRQKREDLLVGLLASVTERASLPGRFHAETEIGDGRRRLRA
jgi:hypothetical protein